MVRHTSLALGEKLRAFRDRIVADGRIVRLHDRVAARFPGVKNAAELKIHVATGGTQNTKRIVLRSRKTPDVKIFRVGPWVRDPLLLFDLAEVSYLRIEGIRNPLWRKGFRDRTTYCIRIIGLRASE